MSNEEALTQGVHEITVEGVRQAYLVAGNGPVCVAHSGGPGLDAEYLRSPALEERFTVVYVEPVGTGRSGRLDDAAGYRLRTYVRFLSAVVEHLGVPQVYLLGHSYGGFVVQSYALAEPARTAGLILYSTAPEATERFWAGAMAGLAAYPQRYPDRPEAAAVPTAFQQAVAASDDASMTRLFAAAVPVYFSDFWSREAEFAVFRSRVRMNQTPASAPDPDVFDVRDRLGELQVPSVVIVGRDDFICGPEWGEPLASMIPDAKVRLLEHSGHFAHIEQPDDFAEAAALILG